MADFKTLFASNFFTRAQVEILRRLYQAIIDETSGGFTQAAADLLYEPINSVSAHEAAADPHPDYLTEAEADALYAAVGHTHGSTDVWSHAVVGVSQTASPGASETDITGMKFTPAANKSYKVEFNGIWEGSATTSSTGLTMGVAWPTGVTGALAATVISGTTVLQRSATAGATFTGGASNAAIANTPYPVTVTGVLVAGATPSGEFQLRMRTNTVGSHTITIKAGSVLSWREIP